MECNLLRGSQKITTKQLRGEGGGALGGGGTGSADGCIKFLGGPVRQVVSLAGNPALVVEVVVRPPMGGGCSTLGAPDLPLTAETKAAFQSTVAPPPLAAAPASKRKSIPDLATEPATSAEKLRGVLDLSFERVGGLDRQLDDIVRRVLASRANPEAARRLGVGHVRGILLSGPPGAVQRSFLAPGIRSVKGRPEGSGGGHA